MVSSDGVIELARLQGGVRAGPAGGGAGDVLARGPAAAAAAGAGGGRALRRPRWPPHRAAAIAERAPRPPRGQPRATGPRRALVARALADARLPRGAGPLHARRPRPRERDRPARRAHAAPDRGGGRARRRGDARTPPAARPTPRRCSSWRACSRGAPRARRWCWRRSTARRSARSGPIRLAEELGAPSQVDAVLVDLRPRVAHARAAPFLQAWSNDSAPGRRSASSARWPTRSARSWTGRPEASGTLGQLARLSFPLGRRRAGPAARARLRRGADLRERRAAARRATARSEAVDEDRLGTLGRATLRTRDRRRPSGRAGEHGPETYLLAVSQVVPGWALALLAGTLLLPVLAVSVDALARARRRRVAVLPWMRWLGAWTAAFLVRARDGGAAGAGGRHPGAAARPDAARATCPLDGAGARGARAAWWLAAVARLAGGAAPGRAARAGAAPTRPTRARAWRSPSRSCARGGAALARSTRSRRC